MISAICQGPRFPGSVRSVKHPVKAKEKNLGTYLKHAQWHGGMFVRESGKMPIRLSHSSVPLVTVIIPIIKTDWLSCLSSGCLQCSIHIRSAANAKSPQRSDRGQKSLLVGGRLSV